MIVCDMQLPSGYVGPPWQTSWSTRWRRGIAFQRGQPTNQVEVPPVSVQIARDHHLPGQFRAQRHDIALSAGSLTIGFRSLVEDRQQAIDVIVGGDHERSGSTIFRFRVTGSATYW